MLRNISLNGSEFIVESEGYDWFWPGVQNGAWEPEIFQALDALLSRSSRMVDIGAWIGPLSLYAAHKCDVVHAYECDPVALEVLRRNMRLNPEVAGKIKLHEYALGAEDGFVSLYSRSLGNSETSILAAHERDGRIVECGESVTCGMRDVLSVFRENGYMADERTLVKIDVEGAEFGIVERLRSAISTSQCTWYISVHELNINPTHLRAWPVRAAKLIQLLEAFGEMKWFDPKFCCLDKERVLNEVLGCTWPVHRSFLFSRRDLTSLVPCRSLGAVPEDRSCGMHS